MLAVVGFFKAMGSDFTKVTDGTFDPPHSTVNFGRLRQGLSGIELHFDARLLPDLVPEEIEKHVQQGVQKIAANYPSLNLSVARERVNPALKMAGDHEFVKICEGAMEDAGLTPATSKKSYATEAAQFHQAGYESVVFGPGAPIGA